MKPIYLLFSILIGIVSFGLSQPNVIPTPHHYQKIDNSVFKFNEFYIVNQRNLDFETYKIMNQWLKQLFGKEFKSKTEENQLIIEFVEDKNIVHSEAYKVTFEGKKVLITYSSERSRLYAFSSLLQLIERDEDSFSLNTFHIRDYPEFPWRGLHLDVSRHFFSVDEVKRYIDLMAFYKYNTFHWHLTDDQGWRIEIKKYPLLTETGGYRDSTLNNHYSTEPRTWNTNRYGGFYTQEQIKDVVNYAKVRGITVVPEIEMPGHARAALAAYPELSCTQNKLPVEGLWGVFDDIFCSKDETIIFLQDVLTEVLELFPSEYIHIGGDEAPKTRWRACESCQNNIRKYNLKDEHELQSWFIRQMDRFLTKRGRKLIGWDEILEGGLSPNAAVMSWRGEEGGIEAANQQHYVVMTPVSHCYFDHYQGDSKNEPIAFGGYTPLEKVYAYNPIPEAISTENRKYILGAQANVWTEYIPDFRQVEYMVYPRALAMIQNLWSVNKPDYNSFLTILKEKQLDILKAREVNYSLSFAKPKIEIEKANKGIKLKVIPEGAYLNSESRQDGTVGFFFHEDRDWIYERENNSAELLIIEAIDSNYKTTVSLSLIHHKGLGVDIDFVTPPHKRFSHNKELTLVDGILGARPWSGNQWLGFNDGIVEFTVKLDEKINYNSITVSLLSATTSWVHLPESIEIMTSSDGKKWKKIAEEKITGEQTKIKLKRKPNQLKFVITPMDKIPGGMPGAGNKPFTFLDELIFE